MSDVSLLDPVEPIFQGARSLVREGLMQTNLDAGGFQIVNLDTSNLMLSEGPNNTPAVHSMWFNSYDSSSKNFGISQPFFTDISGDITVTQSSRIIALGTIARGFWQSADGPIQGQYLTTLDLIRAPVAPVSFNQNRLTNCADAIGDQDAVNLRLVNARLNGLQPKAAVAVATVPLGRTDPAGLYVMDGYQILAGDRVLIKDEVGTHLALNGIYVAAAGAWARSDDQDDAADFLNAITYVQNGTVNAGVTFLETATVVNLNTDPVIWVYFNAGSSTQAGSGLTKVGNTISAVGTTNRISISTGIDIAATYVGQTSITTLGTIATGVWNAGVIPGQYGGTGTANVGKTITMIGNFIIAGIGGAPGGSFLSLGIQGSTTLVLPLSGTLATLAGTETFTNKTWNGGIISPTYGGTGVNNSTRTLTVAGNNIILTSTSLFTNVTLPVTGTLATLANNETFTNKHISGNQIDSGFVNIVNGGTGAITATAAINNLLPDQTGNSGKTLHTNGTNVFWA